MATLEVIVNGEGAMEDWGDGERVTATVHQVQDFTITGMPGGMQSGKPSIAIIINLPNGEKVFAENSLANLLNAADALKAHYGDPRGE